MTYQQTLDTLTQFARDEGITLTTQTQLTFNGAEVSVFAETDLPREGRLYFGGDTYQFGIVLDVGTYLRAIEEGFTDSEAEAQCYRYVESLDEVINYLKGSAYQSVQIADRA